jgi:hypothetical protein
VRRGLGRLHQRAQHPAERRGLGFNVPGSPGYGLPNYVWGPDSKQAFNEPRGVVRNRTPAAPAARNQRFNEAGTGIVQFDQGQFVQSAQIGPRMGGDGASTYDDSDIQTPAKRWIGYLYSEYELADWVKVTGELTYANRTASYSGVTAARARPSSSIRTIRTSLPACARCSPARSSASARTATRRSRTSTKSTPKWCAG